MLNDGMVAGIQGALGEMGLDGWLVFDFQGVNPVASGLLGFDGMVSRRHFALIPREGVPIAFSHAIERSTWRRWPTSWRLETYSTWQQLEDGLRRLVGGKRIAMEYSPGAAVPYLDRIPAGVLEMVRSTGAEVVTSGALVSRFFAALDDPQVASHRRAAEAIAGIAKDGMRMAGERARTASPMHEHELMHWIQDRFGDAGLMFDHGPIVAVAENAANAHYGPAADRPRAIAEGDVLLVDLFAHEEGGVYADQTWMATVGEPSARAMSVWTTLRDARDAAIALLERAIGEGRDPRGGEADDAARAVVRERGFGDHFIHRTGHSIDARSLHGSGPHLDNFETREERAIIPGVAFSIEPGIYIPGEIGMRAEVNAVRLADRLLVTPNEIQRELLIV